MRPCGLDALHRVDLAGPSGRRDAGDTCPHAQAVKARDFVLFVLVSFLPLCRSSSLISAPKQGSMLPESWAVMPWRCCRACLFPALPLSPSLLPEGSGAAGDGARSVRIRRPLPGGKSIHLLGSVVLRGRGGPVMILLAGCIDRMRFARRHGRHARRFLAASIIICREPSDSLSWPRFRAPTSGDPHRSKKFSGIISSENSPLQRGRPPYSSRRLSGGIVPLSPGAGDGFGSRGRTVIVRNFDRMSFSGPKGWYHVIGFERYWSWRLGQWPELSRFLRSSGSFWYARMQANCATGQGMTWSAWDCEWLSRHCRLVERNASDELYLCGPERGP